MNTLKNMVVGFGVCLVMIFLLPMLLLGTLLFACLFKIIIITLAVILFGTFLGVSFYVIGKEVLDGGNIRL